MPRIALDDTDFHGGTSAPPWRAQHGAFKCTNCGTQLAGRREAVRRETTKGIRYVVELFRCPCGRGRQLRRPVEKGAAHG